ncbi:MAG: methyltransferase domain-containing protein [Bacteroidia bacterium]|nr:methyltransferase domain-containing protein [Bacteroidia bacterium]
MASQEHWDKRYSEEEFAYGITPNSFFADQIQQFAKGKILLPAEGQGRNAVFAARLGWDVSAFDYSPVAKERALKLAESENVSISYHVIDFRELDLPAEEYDVVALIFNHMPADLRRVVHKKIVDSLKPGGRLLLEAFHKNQLGRTSGGPKSLELLYSEAELNEDFSGMEIISLEETIAVLDEGPYHQGEAILIRLLARKPESMANQ